MQDRPSVHGVYKTVLIRIGTLILTMLIIDVKWNYQSLFLEFYHKIKNNTVNDKVDNSDLDSIYHKQCGI